MQKNSPSIRIKPLKDVEAKKCSMDDFIVHCRNKKCTYWSNNQGSFGNYLGHVGHTHLVRVNPRKMQQTLVNSPMDDRDYFNVR